MTQLLVEYVKLKINHNLTQKFNPRVNIRNTPSPPVDYRPRCLAPDRLAVFKAEFEAMMRDGTARRVEGPGSSALHPVL